MTTIGELRNEKIARPKTHCMLHHPLTSTISHVGMVDLICLLTACKVAVVSFNRLRGSRRCRQIIDLEST